MAENKDTINLLRQCDVGVKMGITSLGDIIAQAGDLGLEDVLKQSKLEHESLRADTEALLNLNNDKGKSPPTMAKAMSTMKTKMNLANAAPQDAAAFTVEGCQKGIDTLYKKLDKYTDADSDSKQLTKNIIAAEEKLITDLKNYM